LADTLAQVSSANPPRPILECQVIGNDHAWAHVSVAESDSVTPTEPNRYWVLVVGYPLQVEPAITFELESIQLPQNSLFASWQPGIHATIHIPLAAELLHVATTIKEIMVVIHKVSAPHSVELTLDYQE
jgi:hypothetical protein